MIFRFWLVFDLYALAGGGRVGMKCERDKKGLRRFTAIPSYYWYAWQDSNLRPADYKFYLNPHLSRISRG